MGHAAGAQELLAAQGALSSTIDLTQQASSPLLDNSALVLSQRKPRLVAPVACSRIACPTRQVLTWEGHAGKTVIPRHVAERVKLPLMKGDA